jgi:tetratricopeptide (TPR) repeat protein
MPDPYELLDAGIRAERRGALDEALQHYHAAAETDDPWLRSDALRRQASVLRNRAEWDEALKLARSAAEVAAAASLLNQEAEARNAEALVYIARGEFETAVTALERVLASCQDARIRGVALQNLGSIAAQQGEWETARQHFNASVRCFQAAQYDRGVAIAKNNYGRAALDHGQYRMAIDLLAEAIWSADRAEDQDLSLLATLNHAEALAGVGELDRAEAEATAALSHFTAIGNAWRRVECFRVLGDIARARGRVDAARSHYTDGEMLAQRIGAHRERAVLAERLSGLATEPDGAG